MSSEWHLVWSSASIPIGFKVQCVVRSETLFWVNSMATGGYLSYCYHLSLAFSLWQLHWEQPQTSPVWFQQPHHFSRSFWPCLHACCFAALQLADLRTWRGVPNKLYWWVCMNNAICHSSRFSLHISPSFLVIFQISIISKCIFLLIQSWLWNRLISVSCVTFKCVYFLMQWPWNLTHSETPTWKNI